MSQPVIYAAASAPAEPIVSVPVADVCCDLLELFAGVSDGRVGPGRDHPVAAVLALAAAAVVAGMRGYTAITGWVADVPPAILADVYLRSGAAAAPPPSKTTIWRVLTEADAGDIRRGGRYVADEPRPVRRPGRGRAGCRPGGLPADADAGEAGWQGDPGRERR